MIQNDIEQNENITSTCVYVEYIRHIFTLKLQFSLYLLFICCQVLQKLIALEILTQQHFILMILMIYLQIDVDFCKYMPIL